MDGTLTQPAVETWTRGNARTSASEGGRLVFAEERATGRLFHGHVLTLHAGSLRLLLDRAPRPRAWLSLELRPAAHPYAAGPLLVTVRVYGCEATADGIVVRARVARPKVVQRPLRAVPVEDAFAPPATDAQRQHHAPRKPRDRRWVLLLLLLLLAVWLWPWNQRPGNSSQTATGDAFTNSFAIMGLPKRSADALVPGKTAPTPTGNDMAANKFAAPEGPAPGVSVTPSAPPLRFMRGARPRGPAAGLATAGIALGGNRTPMLETEARGATSGVPAPWVAGEDTTGGAPERSSSGPVPREKEAFLPPAWRDDPPPVAIRVRRDAFVVEVLVDGAVTVRMPAGLGRDGSTPAGIFTLANKIVNPVWYNRGDPVPPGDPRNALGRHWLGLADGADRVPYGFHDAAGADDLGRAVSRGCIRLRPEDAARLMRMAPVGTPVCICE